MKERESYSSTKMVSVFEGSIKMTETQTGITQITTHTHTHIHTHTHTHSVSVSLCHAPMQTYNHSHHHQIHKTLTHTHTHTHTVSLSLTHTHTHTQKQPVWVWVMVAARVYPLQRSGCRQVSRLIHEQGFICVHRLPTPFHSAARRVNSLDHPPSPHTPRHHLHLHKERRF